MITGAAADRPGSRAGVDQIVIAAANRGIHRARLNLIAITAGNSACFGSNGVARKSGAVPAAAADESPRTGDQVMVASCNRRRAGIGRLNPIGKTAANGAEVG